LVQFSTGKGAMGNGLQIGQFRYFKIQLQTTDLNTRLRSPPSTAEIHNIEIGPLVTQKYCLFGILPNRAKLTPFRGMRRKTVVFFLLTMRSLSML